MNTALWFAAQPLWLAAIVVVGIPTAVSMAISGWVRHVVALDKLRANNEVAGFKFAVLGVIYAVLLGFVVIVVWEKFHVAEMAVAEESGHIASLYRLSHGLGSGGEDIRLHLTEYLNEAIDHDWPAMSKGLLNPGGTQATDRIYAALLADQSDDRRSVATYSEMVAQIDALTQVRRLRFALAQGAVPGVIWTVLLLGAGATIGYTFFFGNSNLLAQVMMTGLLAVVIFMALMVVVSVNHPFTGDVSVGPEPLEYVLRELGTGG